MSLRRSGHAIAVVGLAVVVLMGCSSGKDGNHGGGSGPVPPGAVPPGGGSPDGGTITQIDLAPNPDLEPLDFPDLDKLDYAKGNDAMCAALEELMSKRGYEKGRPGTSTCEFRTPPAASSQDGSTILTLDIRGAMGTSLYNQTVTETVEYRNETLDDDELNYEWSELEEFPVGKAGFITSWARSDASEARAAFTSGEQSYRIDFVGILITINGGKSDRKPVPAEDLRREIAGVIQTMNGDPDANEPLAAVMEFKEYQGLQDLGAPLPPMEGSEQQRCTALADAAAALQVTLRRSSGMTDGYKCSFNPADMSSGKNRYLDISAKDYTNLKNISAPSALDNQLGVSLASLAEDGVAPTLYELPAGDGGYMYYYPHDDRASLVAAYTVGEIYVEIRLSSSMAGPDVTEAEFVAELADFLTKLGS